MEDVIESHFIELTTKPSNTLLGIIYRPPNNKLDLFKEYLCELLQKLVLQKKKCYLMEDFNLDLLKMGENHHIKDFINLMFSSMFYPLISKPTRITNSSATLIDNIFVNNFDECYKCGILLADLSDHLPVFQITSSLPRVNSTCDNTKYRLINKKAIDQLCQDLEIEDWNDIYNEIDPQLAYDNFYNKLFKLYDKNMPLVKIKNKRKNSQKIPWITKGILKSKKLKISYIRNLSKIQLKVMN